MTKKITRDQVIQHKYVIVLYSVVFIENENMAPKTDNPILYNVEK
jgi:hypothetical protein